MIAEELKKSILNFALCGKLSEQSNSDMPVEEMLISIKEQKKHYKSRLNKFEDKCISEIPFIIPNTWRWIELKNIALDIYAGGDKPKIFSKTITENCHIPVIANGETNDGIVGYTDKPTETENALTIAGRGTIGFSKYRKGPFTPIVRLIVIKLSKEVNYKYLQFVFESLIETGVGTSIKQLTVPMIANKYIPLPPLEEQQRIVDKIEELFAKLDELKPIEEELELLKNNFPSDMKNSIIQSAISGCLTMQNESEGINSIIKIIENKINRKIRCVSNYPFDIPSNWVWIKFGDLVNFEIGKTPPRADNSYWNGEYNWVSISDMIENGIINETKEKVSNIATEKIFKEKISKAGTLLMSFKLTVGRCSLLNIDAFHNEGIISIYPNYNSPILKKYLFKILPFVVRYGDTKGAIKGNTLNSKSLDNLMIPLPPIEEQQRIVDKLEQLLPLCDDIEKLIN